jgi:SAM-dependent methyltransferase
LNKTFSNSAKFYDLIYKEKDYDSETEYVSQNIKSLQPQCTNILELGCGTGNYSFPLRNRGFRVHGIDASPEMVEIANNKKEYRGKTNISFEAISVQNLDLKEHWDAVISLFFMIGYLSNDKDLQKAFSKVRDSLTEGGLFVFDFWNAPCVLKTAFSPKKISVQNTEYKITRISLPTRNDGDKFVRINQQFSIFEKSSGTNSNFEEEHKVRFFSEQEIINILKLNHFELVKIEPFLGSALLNDDSWAGIVYARAKE